MLIQLSHSQAVRVLRHVSKAACKDLSFYQAEVSKHVKVITEWLRWLFCKPGQTRPDGQYLCSHLRSRCGGRCDCCYVVLGKTPEILQNMFLRLQVLGQLTKWSWKNLKKTTGGMIKTPWFVRSDLVSMDACRTMLLRQDVKVISRRSCMICENMIGTPQFSVCRCLYVYCRIS